MNRKMPARWNSSTLFGEFLRYNRKACYPKLTIKEFAEKKLGITGPYLSTLELGTVPPPSDKVLRIIAEVLDVDYSLIKSIADYNRQLTLYTDDPEETEESLDSDSTVDIFEDQIKKIMHSVPKSEWFKHKALMADQIRVYGEALLLIADAWEKDQIEFDVNYMLNNPIFAHIMYSPRCDMTLLKTLAMRNVNAKKCNKSDK